MHNRNFVKWATIFLAPACVFLVFVSFKVFRFEGGYILTQLDFLLGRDLVNTWQYGVAAFTENPALNYNADIYNAKLDNIIPGIDYPYQQWSYPPHFMLLAAPLGLLHYNIVLALFITSSLTLYWHQIVKPFKELDSRMALIFLPALFFCIISGNLSVFIAVILITIFRQMDKRPILVGVLIALLTVKPHIGFLFPIYLLATGRYKVFLAASVATVAFIGSSIVIHGIDVWRAFFETGVGQQAILMTRSDPIILGWMPTLTSNLGIMGVPLETGMKVQIAVAIPLIITMIWVCMKQKDLFLNYSVFLAVSFAVTPYLMVYDTVVLGWLMMSHLVLRPIRFPQKSVYYLLLIIPLLGPIISQFGWSCTYLFVLGLVVWMVYDALPGGSSNQTIETNSHV